MEIEQLGYALAPTPGMPLGVRKQQLETSRFIDIRNLAAHLYKKPGPNGQLVPLMTYNETLDNRDLVRKTILIHEMSCTHQGAPLVVNDGTNLDAPATTQQPPNGVQNGTQMQPPVPQYTAPQPPVGPAAAGAAPMQQYPQPPQQFAPPQQQFAPPPQQAPQAPADPAAVAAAPAPGGRKRRGGGGAAVAPPPAAPPPAAAPQQQFAPPQAPPGAFAAAPTPMQNGQQWTPPQGQAPAAPSWQPPTQAAPPPPMQAAAPAPGIDLTPIFSKLDDLGRGVTYATKVGDELKTQFNMILVALHHLYLSNPATGQATGGQANTLIDFQQFLSKYLPK